MTTSRTIWAVTALLVSLTVVALAISSTLDDNGGSGSSSALETLPPEFQQVAEVWELLKRNHFERNQLDPAVLSQGAVRGMLEALGDPYAALLNPEQYAVESEDFKGFFEGIGATVQMLDGQLTIGAPIPDTPAERAGIRSGDMILEINGESTAGITVLGAVSKIRGPEGTTVDLLVQHRNSSEPVSITITRGVIPIESVNFLMLVGRIGHMRIYNFTETTKKEVQEALERFEQSQGLGLVLDLRGNPGGLLNATVDVASQFLGDGLVLYEVNADGKRTDWKVRSGDKGRDIPMVVLVNEFSASASEVVAGAIMDHERAQVVGTTTFGKGSVNTLRRLTDGSGVYFTTSRWYTPGGTLIEGDGITPDEVVENPEDDSEDFQLDRAIEILQQLAAQRR